MKNLFLRFPDEVASTEALESSTVDLVIDVIGTIHKPTGQVIDTPEGPVAVTTALPGWHVNMLAGALPEALQVFEVFPATPVRVFAVPPPPAPVYLRLLVRDFLALFTQSEKLAIKAATRNSDTLGLWYDEMLAAQFITAEDADTRAGMDALIAHDLLTLERHDEIMASLQPSSASARATPV